MFQKLKTWMPHLEQFQTTGKKMVIKFIFELNKKKQINKYEVCIKFNLIQLNYFYIVPSAYEKCILY